MFHQKKFHEHHLISFDIMKMFAEIFFILFYFTKTKYLFIQNYNLVRYQQKQSRKFMCNTYVMKCIQNGKIICLFKICRKRKKVSIWSPHLSVPISVFVRLFISVIYEGVIFISTPLKFVTRTSNTICSTLRIVEGTSQSTGELL